jgi:mRNA interferase RelE/StbE
MKYNLQIAKPAVKTLKGLDRSLVMRIHARLKELEENPFDPRVSSQIEMGTGERKSRVGDWRIFFEIDEPGKVIQIVAIKPRGKAYKK